MRWPTGTNSPQVHLWSDQVHQDNSKHLPLQQLNFQWQQLHQHQLTSKSLSLASMTTNIFAPRVPYTSRSHPHPSSSYPILTLHVNYWLYFWTFTRTLMNVSRRAAVTEQFHLASDKATTTLGPVAVMYPTHLAIRFPELLDPKWSSEAARLQAEVNAGNHWKFQVFILVVLIGGMKQQIPTAEDLVLWIVSFRSINLHAIQNPPSCSRSVHSVQWMFSRVSF